MIKGKITFSWREGIDHEKYARIGAMYCFKRCDVNVNLIMEFIVAKLNYIAYNLDKLYNINSGGCCYFAYKVAYWLEKYKIDYYFIIQDDEPIINNIGKHYCLQILSNKLFINKQDKHQFIKSIKLSAKEILTYYNNSIWSKKYDTIYNSMVSNIIDNTFNQ